MRSLNDANNNTIAMLIKLLATRMVANNLLGFSSKLRTMSSRLEGSFSEEGSLMSDADSENRATSEPDIKAEQISRTKNKTMLVIWEILTSEMNNKPGGSKPKIVFLVEHQKGRSSSSLFPMGSGSLAGVSADRLSVGV